LCSIKYTTKKTTNENIKFTNAEIFGIVNINCVINKYIIKKETNIIDLSYLIDLDKNIIIADKYEPNNIKKYIGLKGSLVI
jgi:hypothetical protein